ncbi:hypothetical protein CcaverHIS002_0606210 [Cutaneotrichosporon cavernicola]|uniref:Uncharacterized protein n=1 Tax=Cutaneotrichosporon cavernicola TaxID=279322 RepID=A0AA48QY02_9TREE|nr:uncharacterized protein CcaverHIS019_0605680 [Cutaneotrichosporon cavernicola]BEI86334.1 hypothetical protein CcaverHIS002_0606210 [Cutaneotrichosporon cavernicola]BEI94109.1 hypothetical protein CcaverHIS019_0605680 [Cutaneotrichosporon cavernicola]BEJ01887.1 hypothetical protein CcaverHIS631_0605690 [Cutaneotrichosporon cavernicola]BEJ09653.1 hypothetical protein CcaverHIS641_0605680 [Cutaneotrichosporon cavernicola]
MVIDFHGHQHIVLAIFRFSDSATQLSWRATSRFFRDAAMNLPAPEHLVVDPHSGRMLLRTPDGHIPPSLVRWLALQDYGFERSTPITTPWPDEDPMHLTDSDYVPSDDGDNDDDMDVDDLDTLEEEDRRARAELQEVEDCPCCQKWEAAMLAQLPEANAQLDPIIDYASELKRYDLEIMSQQLLRWSHEFEKERFDGIIVPSEFKPYPIQQPGPKPVIDPLPLDEVDDHEHTHEVANEAFWAARAARMSRIKQAFEHSVAKTRVLDVPGPAILHGVEHFTSLEVIRYVGRLEISPAWGEWTAPTLVRFFDLVPPLDKWWEPVKLYPYMPIGPHGIDIAHMAYRSDVDQNPCRPVKKAVFSINYHPEHPHLRSCSVHPGLLYDDYNPELEQLVFILVPSTAAAPPHALGCEFHPGHPYNGREEGEDGQYICPYSGREEGEDGQYICHCTGSEPPLQLDFGPLSNLVGIALKNHRGILDSWVGQRARPRVTIVGLVELGNEGLGLVDGWFYRGEEPYDTLSTAERLYACAAFNNMQDGRLAYPSWSECVALAKQCMRFVSLDEYKAEVGERQFHLETVSPAAPPAEAS